MDTDLTAELALNGESATDDTPETPGTSIADASKAFREAPAAAVTADDTAEANAAVERPRNPDGTFAKAEASADGDANSATPDDAAAEDAGAAADAADVAEPKILKLAGEAQRGEVDVELDVSDLPPEVVERLERNEQRGMRRNEYDKAMSRVASAESELAAFETELKMNAEGVIMEKTSAEAQKRIGLRCVLEHWDDFFPVLDQFAADPTARLKAVTELRDGTRSIQERVTREVSKSRQVAQITRAINTVIPDGIPGPDADEFRAAAWTRLRSLDESGTSVTVESIAQHLAPLAARYGFPAHGESDRPATPQRPKLAVYRPAQVAGAVDGGGTRPSPTAAAQPGGIPTVESMSPGRYREQVQRTQGAKAIAPQGAGGGAARRPAVSPTATIEQASAHLRGVGRR